MCVIHATDNKVVANWCHKNICFTTKDPLKMLLCHFQYFHFSSINLTFVKNPKRKLPFLRQIFKIYSKFHDLTKFCDLATVDSKIRPLWIFFKIFYFLSLIFMLRYFKFEPSFKLRWCRARYLFESQIPVITGRFEMRISSIRNSYLTN